MKLYKSKTLIIILLSFLSLYSQAVPIKNESGKVVGKVYDYDSKHSIEYSNIVLLSTIDSYLITGNITDVNGFFIVQDL